MKIKTHHLAILTILLFVADFAMAGTGITSASGTGTNTGGTYLSDMKEFIQGSLEGTVGITIGLLGLLYGAFSGLSKGSLAGMGTGFGLAAGAFYGPSIITTMSTATLLAF